MHFTLCWLLPWYCSYFSFVLFYFSLPRGKDIKNVPFYQLWWHFQAQKNTQRKSTPWVLLCFAASALSRPLCVCMNECHTHWCHGKTMVVWVCGINGWGCVGVFILCCAHLSFFMQKQCCHTYQIQAEIAIFYSLERADFSVYNVIFFLLFNSLVLMVK